MPDLFEQIYGPAQSEDLFSSIYGAAQPPPAAEDESLLTPIKTTVGSVLEFLNRPSRAVAEASLAYQRGEELLPGVKRALSGDSEASFEDVLAQGGMDEGLKRTLLGLGIDIATDPLNLVGALPFKAVRSLAKLPAMALAGDAAKSVPLVDALGKRFVPFYNLPKAYRDPRRLLESEVAYKKGAAFEEAIERFKGISPEDAKRITIALDEPAKSLGNPKLDKLATEQRAAFADQAQKEIAAGVLPPDSTVDDYVTYLFKGPVGETTRSSLRPRSRVLSAKNPFAKERELTSVKQAIHLGAEPHIARIAAVRKATGDRAIAVAGFFKKAVDEFSVPVEAAPAGFRSVTIAGDMPIKEIFKGRAFDASVAEDLEKLMRPGEASDALDNAFRVATGVWKGYATAANPGFHVRNLASNIFNSWLGGMSMTLAPIRYAEAAAWRLGGRNVGKFTAEEITDAMNRYGVVGAGHGAFGEVTSALDRLAADTQGRPAWIAQQVNPLSRFNAAQEFGREVGQTVEDLSRRALFLDQLHKGKSLEEAALHVKKYLFDYSELTEFERGIRDYAVPFYTWLRKNFPLQIESLIGQPSKYAHVGKAVSEVEEAAEEEGIRVPEGERPKWLQKQDAVQLPVKTTADESVFFSPDLPFGDLNLIPADALAKGTPSQGFTDVGNTVISSLNPLVKMPIELALNREAFTGRDIVNPDIGPEQLVRAPAYLGVLAEASPAVAEQLGMVKSISRQGEEQWTMPARAAYAANQVPFFTKLGRVFASTEAEQQGEVPVAGRGLQPRQLSYFGFGVYPQSDEQRVMELIRGLREQNTQGRRLLRQDAMTIPAEQSELEQMLLRLVLTSKNQ